MPDNDTNEGRSRTTITPLWSKDAVDVESILLFEQEKNNIWLNLDTLTPSQRTEKLTNLFGVMYSKMLKLVDGDVDKIKKFTYDVPSKKKHYTFLDAKRALAEGEADDLDAAREICEIGFTCYELVIKRFGGQGIAQTKSSPPKKLVARLFGLAFSEDQFDAFYKEVWDAFIDQNAPKNMMNFLTYCEFILPNFDVDMLNIRVGRRRSGKSTEFLQELRRITAYKLNKKNLDWPERLHDADKFLVHTHYCEKRIVYQIIQDFSTLLKNAKEEVVCGDDFVLLGDKREGMKAPNIKMSQLIQTCADGDNNFYGLVQDLELIDQRYIDAASTIMPILSRGEALLFSAENSMGLTRQYMPFAMFRKHPNLLRGNVAKKKTILKRLEDYVGEIHWAELGDKKRWDKTGSSGNILDDAYLVAKSKWREKREEFDKSQSYVASEEF